MSNWKTYHPETLKSVAEKHGRSIEWLLYELSTGNQPLEIECNAAEQAAAPDRLPVTENEGDQGGAAAEPRPLGGLLVTEGEGIMNIDAIKKVAEMFGISEGQVLFALNNANNKPSNQSLKPTRSARLISAVRRKGAGYGRRH